MKTIFRKVNVKSTLKVALNVIFYGFILLLLIFAIANIKVKTNADIPNFLGKGFLSVQSESMNGDEADSFKQGDLIFVNMLSDKEIDNLQLGDIITYYDANLRALNTHRIVEIGDNYFITQGDKVAMDPNRVYDPEKAVNDESAYEIISKTEAIGKHTSTWSNTGKTLDYLQSPTGFALFIILPTMLILIFEAVMLVRNIIKYNHTKMEEKYRNEKIEGFVDLDKQKEQMRAELIEELKKEQEAKQSKQE